MPESDTLSPFQQAVREAKAEQSPPDHAPAPPAVSTDTPVESPPPSQDTETPAAGVTDEPADAHAEPDSLITDAEFREIQAKFPNDPVKQRKEMNRRFTQTMQELAPFRDLVRAFSKDAKAAIRNLAPQYGLSVSEPSPQEATAHVSESITADALAQIRKDLGPDFDMLAEPIARALYGAITRTVTPLREAQEQTQQQQRAREIAEVERESVAMFQAFEAKHPDWKQHENAMIAFMERLPNTGGKMPFGDYVEMVYGHVTRDQQIHKSVTDGVKAALEKMTKAAQTAESPTPAVPASRVEAAPRKSGTIREFFHEAKQEALAKGA